MGSASIFLRLSGCSLRCPYCDTKDSWEEGTLMTIAEIIAELDSCREKCTHCRVVITGGEPLEQDLSPLVAALKKKKYFVAIETNGTIFQEVDIDWWTVSPKDVKKYFIHEKLFFRISEVKLVVTPALSMEVIRRIRGIREDFFIFLQPDWYDKDRYKNVFRLFEQCREAGLRDVRCGIQLHKIYAVK